MIPIGAEAIIDTNKKLFSVNLYGKSGIVK